MLVKVMPDGEVQMVVSNEGDGQAAADLIVFLQARANCRSKSDNMITDQSKLDWDIAPPKLKRTKRLRGSDKKPTEKQQQIIDFVAHASSSGASRQEIMKGLNIPDTQIYTRLRSVQHFGWIKKGTDGMYKVVP